MNVLGLVQLCGTVPPAQGYGHNLDVHRLARQGRLSSPEQLAQWVMNVLSQSIGPTDGIAAGVSFRCTRACDFDAIPELGRVLNSDRVPEPIRLASLQMGDRLWGISRAWPWAEPVHQQLDPLAARTGLHHAVAFGSLISETTASQIRAIAAYLFHAARGLIIAAVEAIPLDEAAGQHILSSVQPAIAELASTLADKGTQDIAAANSEMGHERGF